MVRYRNQQSEIDSKRSTCLPTHRKPTSRGRSKYHCLNTTIVGASIDWVENNAMLATVNIDIETTVLVHPCSTRMEEVCATAAAVYRPTFPTFPPPSRDRGLCTKTIDYLRVWKPSRTIPKQEENPKEVPPGAPDFGSSGLGRRKEKILATSSGPSSVP